jgi:hypothetical protein
VLPEVAVVRTTGETFEVSKEAGKLSQAFTCQWGPSVYCITERGQRGMTKKSKKFDLCIGFFQVFESVRADCQPTGHLTADIQTVSSVQSNHAAPREGADSAPPARNREQLISGGDCMRLLTRYRRL